MVQAIPGAQIPVTSNSAAFSAQPSAASTASASPTITQQAAAVSQATATPLASAASASASVPPAVSSTPVSAAASATPAPAPAASAPASAAASAPAAPAPAPAASTGTVATVITPLVQQAAAVTRSVLAPVHSFVGNYTPASVTSSIDTLAATEAGVQFTAVAPYVLPVIGAIGGGVGGYATSHSAREALHALVQGQWKKCFAETAKTTLSAGLTVGTALLVYNSDVALVATVGFATAGVLLDMGLATKRGLQSCCRYKALPVDNNKKTT